MSKSTVTSKGQTTVPPEIRALVNAQAGTRLVWTAMPDGTLIMRAKTKSIFDLAGSIKPAQGQHVSIKNMNAWR